jgi:hypothetical protein
MRPPLPQIDLAIVGCGTIGLIQAEFARDYPGIGWCRSIWTSSTGGGEPKRTAVCMPGEAKSLAGCLSHHCTIYYLWLYKSFSREPTARILSLTPGLSRKPKELGIQ